jgi:RNA polymerase sigma-70 factor (ECF subfamily)
MNVCAQARSRPRPEVSLERGPDRTPLDPGGADAAFADLELRDRLEKAIAQLPEHYRFLIAAHHLRGVQYEALAEALDIPLGTVKTHLHRAKRQLRELLSK